MKSEIELSIIISASWKKNHENVTELYRNYKKDVETTGMSYEFIYVLDAESVDIIEELIRLNESGENIKIVRLAKWFGEAAALNAGFEQSVGKKILTLPAYKQIDDKEIPAIINSFVGCDMLIASRSRSKDNFFHRLQAKIFHFLIKLSLGMRFSDLGCSVRIFNREILEEIYLYGDQHRFLPLIASRYGFKVKEHQASSYFTDAPNKIYSVGHYTERIVDFISIFFLIKFTKKPLRFFGFPGFIVFLAGLLMILYLFVERVFFSIGLANRPIVLVSILLIVLGIQLFAIGLVAEIIIFTHSKDSKEYIVEEVINKHATTSVDNSGTVKIKEKAP